MESAGPARASGRIRIVEIALISCIVIVVLALFQLTPSSDRERPIGLQADLTEPVATQQTGRAPDASPPSESGDSRLTHADPPQGTRRDRQSAADGGSSLQRGVSTAATGSGNASAAELERAVSPGEVSAEMSRQDQGEEEVSEEPEDEKPLPSLSGWVFDESGEGVPNLGVVATVKRPAPEAEVSSGASRLASTRTDGEGFFALPSLVDGDYEVRTESTDRYESASGRFRAGVDSAVLVVTEKTSRWALIRGFVESADGGSVENAVVVPVGQFENRTSTDGRGAYELSLELDPGRRALMVRYSSEGYREQRLTIADEELRSGQEVIRDVLLEPLRQTTTVSGSVVSTEGTPVHRARVELYSASLSRRADGATDRDGLFSIPEVELSDDYLLWVRPPEGFEDYLEEGLVVTGWVDLDIVVEKTDWSRLEGRMVDPDGQPVPGYTLWLRTASNGGPRELPVTGDDLGQFEVDQLPSGTAGFQTLASPFLSMSGIELMPGDPNRVHLRLDIGDRRAGGFVLDQAGAAIGGAQLHLFWSVVEGGIRSRSKRETVSDANGYFLFTGLGASAHTLTVTAPGYRSGRLELDPTDDGQDVTIRLVDDSL